MSIIIHDTVYTLCMQKDTPEHAMGKCTAGQQAALVISDKSDTPVQMSDVSTSLVLLKKVCW